MLFHIALSYNSLILIFALIFDDFLIRRLITYLMLNIKK